MTPGLMNEPIDTNLPDPAYEPPNINPDDLNETGDNQYDDDFPQGETE